MQEDEAYSTVQRVVVGSVLLYLGELQSLQLQEYEGGDLRELEDGNGDMGIMAQGSYPLTCRSYSTFCDRLREETGIGLERTAMEIRVSEREAVLR